MATLYSNIYDVFLRNVTDYSLASLTTEELENVLQGYMESAIANTHKYFTVDLSNRDNSLKKFNVDIDATGVELLGKRMVVEWLSPVIKTSEILKQVLTDRDFKIYSQANHLEKLIELKTNAEEDVDRLIMYYNYNKEGLEELR